MGVILTLIGGCFFWVAKGYSKVEVVGKLATENQKLLYTLVTDNLQVRSMVNFCEAPINP
ncbi:MAG: hypothetical protein D3923_05720 [Candidatus Electrothrix sp. AR3]|nr:hypothetical protein [Candidatus Electrothrix sp. AR3]